MVDELIPSQTCRQRTREFGGRLGVDHRERVARHLQCVPVRVAFWQCLEPFHRCLRIGPREAAGDGQDRGLRSAGWQQFRELHGLLWGLVRHVLDGELQSLVPVGAGRQPSGEFDRGGGIGFDPMAPGVAQETGPPVAQGERRGVRDRRLGILPRPWQTHAARSLLPVRSLRHLPNVSQGTRTVAPGPVLENGGQDRTSIGKPWEGLAPCERPRRIPLGRRGRDAS